MKHSFKKLLSTLLAFALLFGMSGSTAFAFDADNFVPELYELDGTEAEDEKTTPTPALTLSLSDSSLKIEIGDTAELEATATVGKDFGLDGIASQISAAFTQTFDGKPGYDAVLTTVMINSR